MKYFLILMLSFSLTEGKASNENLTFDKKDSFQTITMDSAVDYAKGAIRKYLESRPTSVDSVEGIHQWWIVWPTQPESIQITLLALEQLEAEGVVERVLVGNLFLWRKAQ